MPNIIQGEPGTTQRALEDVKYEYEYPNELNLSPTSETSKKLVTKLLQISRTSANYMSRRHKPSFSLLKKAPR